MKYKKIQLGDFTAHQFTVFEFKRVFSIIFYWFKGQGWQDRYHNHAFNAISIRLWGSYQERILCNGQVSEVPRDTARLKCFSRNHFHCLGKSPGCLVLLFAGPWQKTWEEIKAGRVRVMTWGRKVIA